MPERTLMNLLQQGWEIFLPVLLGLVGGVVRIMQTDGPCTWRGRLAALSAAGFAGYVLFSLMEAAGVPAGVAGAFTTISGYVGRPLLDIISARLCTIAKTTKQ
eukprot:TRINITY_DN65626_c0_g1_i1.p2 TRINITY_DN65626_c0_g1~~TRINITY_DN65626_c0_g1_i1.p2  ORF type:complete len:103 (-),score=12.94 TRINITY_DN65626_c0_g1_i1:240-548(-)